MGLQRATSIVPYLTPEEVYQMADTVLDGRNGERDRLLILLLFQTGLRVSEALSLAPRLLGQHNGKPVIHLKKGKGKKPRLVACRERDAALHRIRLWLLSPAFQALERGRGRRPTRRPGQGELLGSRRVGTQHTFQRLQGRAQLVAHVGHELHHIRTPVSYAGCAGASLCPR